jgi:hypothetical protein
MSDGKVAQLKAAIRTRIVLAWEDLTKVDPLQLGIFRPHEVQIFKLPAAQLLGSLKRGIKERASEKKRRACRSNGMRPCRPGRRRGRPRKNEAKDSGGSLREAPC